MLENLEVSFATITWFITCATLATLFMLRIWGPISDRMGNRPVLIVAGAAHALTPLFWIVAQPDTFYWPLVLAQVNILIKLAPKEGRSLFIAVFNGAIGLSVAVAPIVGGSLLEFMKDWQVSNGRWTLTNLHFLFLLSGGLQILVLGVIAQVREEGAARTTKVLFQLGSELDPQNGVGNATDFVVARVARTSGGLRGIDALTDRWAERCERRVAHLYDRFQDPARHSLRRLRRLLFEY